LYNIWRGMKQRCFNPKNSEYNRFYGINNITICGEWLDYQEFNRWALANGYRKGLSIDRIDNKGNYEPNNCQWITLINNANKARSRVTLQLDKDGNIIKEYISAAGATKETGITHIDCACSGRRKSAGGFTWRWK